ncbi:alpha/beta hydrolase [Modestobacter sp. VKM Ac-2986]|uniref:alpha/beta fold hydrolase n=1 Tax=Modestobacter sp. VKM Ac-2986 TaxID=3004140 RepID=UPI0022AB9ECD|nr:alpha/beta hydrolase [Modestobacter sp. VKM Ac-2986]MCZ2830841.1 alpha/beta hydrolase [Modestobacter sp. VKM Ac-2986]
MWVPGLGLDARSSARVRDLVGGRVVLLPGNGRRGPVGPLAELTAQLQAGLGAGPVVLVGHSQSCQVVAAVAERDRRVTAVLLLGPTTDPRMLRLRVLAGRWLRTALGEPWWQVPLLLSQWLQTGPPAMAALWRRIAADRLDERLRRVGVPVVVVRGSRDALCPQDWAVLLAGCAPRGRLVELPGAGHMLPHTRPAELAALVRELQSVSV